MSQEILDAALLWYAAGGCVLPAAADGTKRPGLSGWKAYQRERPDIGALAAWFASGQYQGLGVVCGAVSGGLELIEFEGRAMDEGVFEAAEQACEALGLSQVWRLLNLGYVEESPAGGRHLLYRIGDGPVPGNTKIARRPATIDELDANPAEKVKGLIETRGEGGWVVLAPSGGSTHPTGRAWRVECGSPASVPTITREERDNLVQVLRGLDQCPVPAEAQTRPTLPTLLSEPGTGAPALRPGDDFEARTSWEEILCPHGWTRAYQGGRVTYWRRPGKNIGQSATTGWSADRDRLFVFSSSTPFEPEIPYTKFGAYALLEHGGDHSAAAKALAAAGFGAQLPPPGPSQAALIADLLPSGTAPVVPEVTTATMPANPSEKDIARFVAAHAAPHLRYCPALGWLCWDGRVWREQDRDGGQHAWAEWGCEQVPNPKGLIKWGSAATLNAVETLMRRSTGLRISADDVDADAHLLNTPAGVVDLRDGSIGPHDPARLMTRITTASPGPKSAASRFWQFLDETFAGDASLLAYVQVLLGYLLFGHNREQIFVVFSGEGGNGKSLLMNTVMRLLGSYANKGDSDWLMVRRNGPHASEIGAMVGVRFMYFSEIGEFNNLDERRVKELSGGERVRFRNLYKEFGSFEPVATLALLCNELPKVRQGGKSLHRRVRAIHFRVQVPEDRVDVTLPALFATPVYAGAILSWLIEGAVAYHRHGLISPPQVIAAGEDFRRKSIPGGIVDFVEDMCQIGVGHENRVLTDHIYLAYRRWCDAQGEARPVEKIQFSHHLTANFDVGRAMSRDAKPRRCYTNVALRQD